MNDFTILDFKIMVSWWEIYFAKVSHKESKSAPETWTYVLSKSKGLPRPSESESEK